MLTLEQLQRRQSCLTASSVASVLGISKWGTGFDVYASKTKPLEVDEPSPAQLRGHIFEAAIIDFFERELRAVNPDLEFELIFPSEQETPFTLEDWRGATPDCLLVLDDEVILIDAKTQRERRDWGDTNFNYKGLETGTRETTIPLDYDCQMRWSMPIVQDTMDKPCHRSLLVVFFTLTDTFEVFSVDRNACVEEQMVENCRNWWWKHIVAGVEPELDHSTSACAAVKERFPPRADGSPAGEMRSDDGAGKTMVEQLKAVKLQKKALEEEQKTLENRLKAYIGDADGIIGDGFKATWKPQKGRASIDMKRLKTDHPEIISTYTKQEDFYKVLRIR